MAQLKIISGNPKSGKSGLLTASANNDPAGVYLGRNNDELGGFQKQSRAMSLESTVPFIFIRDKIPTMEDILKQAPAAKTIYVDEAQHGTPIKDAIFGYLNAGYDVTAGGVMHFWEGTTPLMERADKIIIVEGGVMDLDNPSQETLGKRKKLLNEHLARYAGKITFVDFAKLYRPETCR